MPQIFDSDYINVTIDDGILICDMKPRDEIDLKVAKIGADQRIKACNGKSYPTIFLFDYSPN